MKKFLKDNLGIIAIAFLLISILVFSFNLFSGVKSWVLTIIGCILSAIGIVFVLYDENNAPKRGFKIVKSDMRKSDYVHFPTRSTTNSAGYDFYANKDYIVAPNEIIKIWTDIKVYMDSDEFLMLDVRSSMGGKFMLANTIGIIDSDYYENPDNDGNIGIFLKNISNETQYIKRDDKIAQGIFMKYLRINNDNVNIERKGGFGSTNK